jgi:pyruvoyl-dependent arginine decarboxylase (PvlArgDC)
MTKGVSRVEREACGWRKAGQAKGASNIIPPGCEIILVAEGKELLRIGQTAFSITAECSTKEPRKLIAASRIRTCASTT